MATKKAMVIKPDPEGAKEGTEGDNSPVKQRPKRQYTEVQKSIALTRLQDNGGNVSKTAAEMDIPRDTLRRWAEGVGVSVAVVNMHQNTRGGRLAEWETIATMARAALKEKVPSADAWQLIQITGLAERTVSHLEESDAVPREAVESILENLERVGIELTNEDDREKVAALIERVGEILNF